MVKTCSPAHGPTLTLALLQQSRYHGFILHGVQGTRGVHHPAAFRQLLSTSSCNPKLEAEGGLQVNMTPNPRTEAAEYLLTPYIQGFYGTFTIKTKQIPLGVASEFNVILYKLYVHSNIYF